MGLRLKLRHLLAGMGDADESRSTPGAHVQSAKSAVVEPSSHAEPITAGIDANERYEDDVQAAKRGVGRALRLGDTVAVALPAAGHGDKAHLALAKVRDARQVDAAVSLFGQSQCRRAADLAAQGGIAGDPGTGRDQATVFEVAGDGSLRRATRGGRERRACGTQAFALDRPVAQG